MRKQDNFFMLDSTYYRVIFVSESCLSYYKVRGSLNKAEKFVYILTKIADFFNAVVTWFKILKELSVLIFPIL